LKRLAGGHKKLERIPSTGSMKRTVSLSS